MVGGLSRSKATGDEGGEDARESARGGCPIPDSVPLPNHRLASSQSSMFQLPSWTPPYTHSLWRCTSSPLLGSVAFHRSQSIQCHSSRSRDSHTYQLLFPKRCRHTTQYQTHSPAWLRKFAGQFALPLPWVGPGFGIGNDPKLQVKYREGSVGHLAVGCVHYSREMHTVNHLIHSIITYS